MQNISSENSRPRKKHVTSELMRQFLLTTPKPKKPKNAFVLYSEERRPFLTAMSGGAAKMKQLAIDWKNSSSDVVDKYQAMALPGVQRHREEMEKWKKSFLAFKNMHTVKGPSKPFIIFRSQINAQRKAMPGNRMDGKAISRLAKQKWMALSDSEKQKYIDIAASDAERYSDEMVKKGSAIIPKRAAIDPSIPMVAIVRNPEVANTPVTPVVSNKKRQRPISQSEQNKRPRTAPVSINDSSAVMGAAQTPKPTAQYSKHLDSTLFSNFLTAKENDIRNAQSRSITKAEVETVGRLMWENMSKYRRMQYR